MMKKEECNDQKMSCCRNEAKPSNVVRKNNMCPVCRKKEFL